MFPGRADVRQTIIFLGLKQGDMSLALDAALGGDPEDVATSRNVDFVVDEALRRASASLPKDPARAKELADFLRARLGRDALTEAQQSKLAEIEAQSRADSGRR